MQRKVESLEKEASEPSFWENSTNAQLKMRDLAVLRGEIQTWSDLSDNVSSTVELFALAVEEDDETLSEQLRHDLDEYLSLIHI